MIIAVDYDGTLVNGGKLDHALIDALRARQRRGDTVILWTCREGKRLQEALRTLQSAGFRPQLVNANALAATRMLGYDPRKIYADLYIDDKGAAAWILQQRHGSASSESCEK